ncbi:DUF397 domain-containing protein [Actinomadura sp. 9N407]|uniref:DUF397 domain-containing protein n=1 Tax=Actinomadura sp. 9N407 TaxID=3375154 RepID=UPI0037937B40
MPSWRKSSHSGGVNDEQCVELAQLAESVGVRDSKDPAGGHLSLSVDQFAGLVEQIKHSSSTS